MGYYVPDTLKKLDNWVLWRIEDTGKGKASKVPYSAKTGRRASTADRQTWTSYEEACARLEYDDFAGIGFVFTPDTGLVFIDIDDCITHDGEESAFAAEIQALFPGTYTEISQSETGLHIICKGILPHAIKRKEIELYSSGRYMAFTGNATSPTEPQEGQGGINTLISRYKPAEVKIQRFTGNSCRQTAEELIEVIQRSRQGAKFERLFAGDWTGYKSQSEADQAFINIVNYFSKSSDAVINELWQRSKLSDRAKGARPDYIASMIENARNTYTGSQTKGAINRSRVTDQPETKRKRAF